MNRKEKLFYAVAGFLIGNVILVSMIYAFTYAADCQSSKSAASYSEARERIASANVKWVNVKEYEKADGDSLGADHPQYLAVVSEALRNELARKSAASNLLDRLFQILFILFIISPPIIVVLLLVIISKMNRKNSLD